MDVASRGTRRGATDPETGSEMEPGLSRATVVGIWVVVVGFALVTAFRSAQVGIGLRDPGGKLVAGRFVSTVLLVLVIALAHALWTSVRDHRSLLVLPRVIRAQWPWRRTWAVAMAIVAYHVVYICYRNMKSWVAFRADHDPDLMAIDRDLFGGHTPALLLHDLLGEHTAALILNDVYDSFPKLVTLSVAGTLVLVRPVRRSYLFLAAMMWIWILGIATYYLVPTLGPFATYPQYFSGLGDTAVAHSQALYVVQRDALLAHPGASDTYASISAFASLHVGVTCVIMLMAHRYGRRWLTAILAVYLAVIMVATVYVGMHFVVDDIAGVLIALASVRLGQLTVGSAVSPRRRRDVRTADEVDATADERFETTS